MIDTLPFISILIPAYNQPQFIKQAVSSALAQDYPHLEVIVSDDSTNAETQDVLQCFISEGRLLYSRNNVRKGRVGNYRHLLYQLAKGDWVLMLDGDDYLIDSHYISDAVLVIQANKNVVLVGATMKAVNDFSGKETLYGLDTTRPVFPGMDMFSKHFRVPAHQTALYPRKLAIELDFYRDPSTASDAESFFRLCLCGDVGYFQAPTAVWRVHQVNTTFTRNLGKQIRELTFIQRVYDVAKARVDKFTLDNWRRNMYSSVCAHLLHLAFKSKTYRYVYWIVLRWGGYLGWKLSLIYIGQTFGFFKPATPPEEF